MREPPSWARQRIFVWLKIRFCALPGTALDPSALREIVAAAIARNPWVIDEGGLRTVANAEVSLIPGDTGVGDDNVKTSCLFLVALTELPGSHKSRSIRSKHCAPYYEHCVRIFCSARDVKPVEVASVDFTFSAESVPFPPEAAGG